VKLDKSAAHAQRLRNWNMCQQWHFLAERRQQELDAIRAQRGMRKRRARGIGKPAAAYATALIARLRFITPTRVRQIVHMEQALGWKRQQDARRWAAALSKALEDAGASIGIMTKAACAERARIIDEANPESSVAKRRGKLRDKRLRDKLAKRVKRRSASPRERTQRMLSKHPTLSVYSTERRRP
jgi:hypothetical protein